MGTIDWGILIGTLLFIVGYGTYKSRGNKNVTDYIKGGNEAKWWTIGLSVMATQASAITFLSTPGQAFHDGMGFVQFYFGLPLAMVVICLVFIPLYHKLKVFTAYEYLESRFDRNFLRNEILPMLESRWPASIQRLSRSAALAGEAQVLLDGLAKSDLEKVGSAHRIEIAPMIELDEVRQRNLLRYAIRQLELQSPPSTRLSQIVDELVHARQDAQPLVSWPGAEVRRYRGRIYLLAASLASERRAGRRLTPEKNLDLGPGMGCLSLAETDGLCIDSDVATAGLTIRFRDGGESIRPVGHDHSQKLKKLLQDAAVVPWMRERIPLLYSGDDLVAVADLWTAAEFSKPKGYRVRWHERPEIN